METRSRSRKSRRQSVIAKRQCVITQEEEDVPTPTSLASMLSLIVDSGYLNVSNVCKLRMVSKLTRKAAMKPEIWRLLCHRDFPNTKFLSVSTIDKAGGYYKLYWKWCCGPLKKVRPNNAPAPLLGPPKYAAHELTIFAQITHNNKPAVSIPMAVGERFLETGEGTWILEKPYKIGKAEWDYCNEENVETNYDPNGEGLAVWYEGFDQREFNVQLHLMRQADGKMCCIFEPREYSECLEGVYVHPKGGRVVVSRNTAKFDVEKQTWSSVNFEPWGYGGEDEELVWELSPYAADIYQRLNSAVRFTFSYYLGVVDHDQFGIAAISVEALVRTPDGSGGFDWKTFNSVEESKKSGVTLLHVLSALRMM